MSKCKNILNQHLKNIGMFWYTIGRGVGKVCLKFPASAGRLCVKLATQPVYSSWETSNTLVQPLLGSNQKKFFWRLLTEANSKGFYYNELDS